MGMWFRNSLAVGRASDLEARPSVPYGFWVAVAVVVVVGGIVASTVAARASARNHAEQAQNEFVRSSGEVASTLQLAIQHEEDLVVSASAFFVGNPTATTSDFRGWLRSMRAFERYPELQGIGMGVIVPRAQLPAFAARDRTLPSDGTFHVVPPGVRSFYCLPAVAVSPTTSATQGLPPGLDFCSGAARPAYLGARDSGQGSYLPFTLGQNTLLSVNTPIYRGGITPSTVAARRQAFVGWVGTITVPKVVLERALQGHPETEVMLTYRRGASSAAFPSGPVPAATRSLTTELGNGWTVTTFAAVPAAGIFANANALALLAVGVLLSALLGGFLFVLGTGRARALKLVRQRTGELRHQALHDALTGLPNRALIADRIEQLLARNRRNGTEGAVLYVDLDEFKNINDTLGHEAGDRLLTAVTARLTSSLRDADTIGRMGGDEFVILIDGSELKLAPELVAQRVLDVMRQPFELEGVASPLIVHTSVGIAIGDRPSGSDLVRDADVALYTAKAAGKNCFSIFDPEMQSDISRRIEDEFELRSALANSQFRLVYQPTYNLADLSLVGVEALLRWDHPTRGLVLPDDFIPILEQTGQIQEVGNWVLREACTQMATWHSRGDALDLSVNVSARQLDSDAIIDQIHNALEESGLPPTSLIIEITETALMRHAAATADRLEQIKQLGVRIAVDDFGTGYSSLAYLRQFPVDCLKIDRSFTEAITTSPESKALIGTLVQLGKDLGLTTLAEGIETTGQIDHLRSEDVSEAQGFLLSKPLDPNTLETRLLEPSRPQRSTTTRP